MSTPVRHDDVELSTKDPLEDFSDVRVRLRRYAVINHYCYWVQSTLHLLRESSAAASEMSHLNRLGDVVGNSDILYQSASEFVVRTNLLTQFLHHQASSTHITFAETSAKATLQGTGKSVQRAASLVSAPDLYQTFKASTVSALHSAQLLKEFCYLPCDGEMKWINVRQCIDWAMSAVSALNENVAITQINGTDDLIMLRGDERSLAQAFTVLILNAIHAISQGHRGSIRIQTVSDDFSVCLVVADTGSGMDRDQILAISNLVHDVQVPSTRLGFGLELVKETVRRHAGEVTVESAIDAGTCIRITLPLRGYGQRPEPIFPGL